MAVKVITGPTVHPVTLAEAKAHCRIDTADDDALVDSLIAAVTAHLDGPRGILGRSLKPQTLELVYDCFPVGPLRIPYPPLIAVDSVKYIDPTTGLTATFAGSSYEVDTDREPGWVVLASDASWPTTLDTINAVRVRYQAGYADDDSVSPAANTVPEPIRRAMLIMVADLYENRESVVVGAAVSQVTIPAAAEMLLYPFRVWAF